MKISEVMKVTGLTKKAIYYFEDEGLISPQKDIENSYRRYSEKDLHRLVQFVLSHQTIFEDMDKYMVILSSRFQKYRALLTSSGLA